MHSAIYEGHVRHHRYEPRSHVFSYSLFMLYLDLDELPEVFRGRWLWSAGRPALAQWRRSDHLGDPAIPLADEVRNLVDERTGRRPAGPIRLLTHLRYYGYCFNPVSFYYCFDACGEHVEAIVAEVNNTPWGECHAYVLPASGGAQRGRTMRFRFRKDFHVSPFMPMDHDYDWRMTAPGKALATHMQNFCQGRRVFDATMHLRRRAITGGALAGALLRYPFMTGRVVAAIYWQALRLWLKRVPYFPHPTIAVAPGKEEL